jgi:hypothetical protein
MCRKGKRSSQDKSDGSLEEQLMSEGIKRVPVAATAVADDENGERDSKDSFIDQKAVSSDSLICKNSSVAEVEISPFFFWKSMSQ